MGEFIRTLPLAALLLVLASYFVGVTAGAWLAGRLSFTAHRRQVIMVTLLFTAASVMNLLAFPHPAWFWAANFAVVFGGGWIALFLLGLRRTTMAVEREPGENKGTQNDVTNFYLKASGVAIIVAAVLEVGGFVPGLKAIVPSISVIVVFSIPALLVRHLIAKRPLGQFAAFAVCATLFLLWHVLHQAIWDSGSRVSLLFIASVFFAYAVLRQPSSRLRKTAE
ncbi:MAG: hypothetical protein Q8J74_05205 [Candidatus Didemnitutus sp.]|nr:hypothetical protein [Candidatus Didemnitutus sp.]